MMELIRIKTVEQLYTVKHEWSQILATTHNSNPFIEFEWVALWMKYYGNEQDVEIIGVKRRGEFVGFLPFVKKKNMFGDTYEMIGYGKSNYMDLIVQHHMLEDVVHFVFKQLMTENSHSLFNLHGLLESSPTYQVLLDCLEKMELTYSYHRVVTPYINLEKIQMKQYMDKRKKLHRLDRREKKLHLLGTVEHRICELEEMDYIFQLHDKRWDKKNDTSGFTNEVGRAFYTELLLVGNERFKPIVDALYVDGKMIAFNYGYSCGNRYLSYVLGYDDDFESFSPGRVLEKEAILGLVDTKYTIFDLSIGYEPYKFEWNTHLDYTTKLIFSSRGAKVRLGRRYFSFKERLIEQLKKNRKLVLFKRDTLGEVKYTISKMFKHANKESKKETLYQLIHKVKRFLWEKNRALIMVKEVERTRKPGMGEGFTELQLKDALYDPTFQTHNLKRICTRLYGGYQAYYKNGEKKEGNLLWTNRKVLRLNRISYIKELRKNAIWLEDWNVENLLDICKFVHKEHLINCILLEIDAKDKKAIQLVTDLGFRVEKSVSSTTIFGKEKIRVIENEAK
ncbi:GNAT family N-acetyltransferase [Sporosarcina sp. OR05]|uniref:GNAT family N-acetyltransferase n=1 Tax=Sporosarcina sp. OR05 TaxID=2969819 RepID=UPI00352A3699